MALVGKKLWLSKHFTSGSAVYFVQSVSCPVIGWEEAEGLKHK